MCLGSVSAFVVGAPSEKAPFNKVEQANEKTVGGQVLDENGEPVIGATVTVKGTKTAVVTDIDGKFSFKVPAGSTLVVTYLGYADKEVAATGTGMTINMAQDEKTLDEVVVTALGIKRSEKALSYNVQQLGNEDLTTVKSTNFMNSLAGKVAGVNINASSAGMGGATRVVMRGPKSINQSNSALYVVDGVPINNRNKIIDLLADPEVTISTTGLNGVGVILKKGGTMGDVYSYTDFARDREGNIALDASGNVIRKTLSNPKYLGSVLPKGNIGFSNEFSWKGINLGFLLTARLGGIVMSQTQAIMDYYGVSKTSAAARENGGIPVNTGLVPAEKYYAVVGGDNPIWSEYTYSATNVRLQEAHISYDVPKKWLAGLDLSLSLTANNLWMIYCKAPFDPESTASTGTFYQALDYFMQPSLRSLGFNVKLKF